MKGVFENVKRATELINRTGLKNFKASAHPSDVARAIESKMRYVKRVGADLERIGAKEGSVTFFALGRKSKLGATAAEFSDAAERFKGRVKDLQVRHLDDHQRYIKLRDHNAPIWGKIDGLKSKIRFWNDQRKDGNKFDYDLSDRELSTVESERRIHNKPIDEKIYGLEREVSILRKKLI